MTSHGKNLRTFLVKNTDFFYNGFLRKNVRTFYREMDFYGKTYVLFTKKLTDFLQIKTYVLFTNENLRTFYNENLRTFYNENLRTFLQWKNYGLF